MSNGAAYAALAKAQAKFPKVDKDAINPHFNKKYASLASIVEAVRGPLTEAGLGFFHRITDGGCETLLVHESGEVITSGPLGLISGKNDMQGYGSALTYAKRYGLQMVTGIVADEDDDGNAAVASVQKPRSKPATKPAVAAKAPPSTKESIEKCKKPEELTALLMNWRSRVPVGTDVERWKEVHKESCLLSARRIAEKTPGWETAKIEPVHAVLDEIARSLEFVSAGEKLFETNASATEGGL